MAETSEMAFSHQTKGKSNTGCISGMICCHGNNLKQVSKLLNPAEIRVCSSSLAAEL